MTIARVWMTKVKLIFVDKPTYSLDLISRETVFDELRKLTNSGTYIIMVTYDIEQVVKTDCSLILCDGIITSVYDHLSKRKPFEAMFCQ